MPNLPAVRPTERTLPPSTAVTVAVVAPVTAGRGECTRCEHRNAAAWTDIARFLVAQANPGLRYLPMSR